MALEKFSFRKPPEPQPSAQQSFREATETLAKMLDLESRMGQISQELGKFITDADLAAGVSAMLQQLDPIREELKTTVRKELAIVQETLAAITAKSTALSKFVTEESEKQRRQLQENLLLTSNKLQTLQEQRQQSLDLTPVQSEIFELRSDLHALASELVTEIEQHKHQSNRDLLDTVVDTDRKLELLYAEIQEQAFDPAPVYASLEAARTDIVNQIHEVLEQQLQEIAVNLNEQSEKIRSKDLEIREQLTRTLAQLKLDLTEQQTQQLSRLETLESSQNNLNLDLTDKISVLRSEHYQLDSLIQKQNKEFLEKISFVQEALTKVNTKTILTEEVMPAPAATSSDPLTPLNKNFVTFEQLKQHYQLFINRIQQQLSTLGGGGSSKLNELDDVDFASIRDSSANGWPLVYKTHLGKWAISNVMSDATFTGNLGVEGFLSVAGNIVLADATIDLLTVNSNALFAEDVTIEGNLRVQGQTSYIQTETITIDDNIMVLNANVIGAPTENAGLEIERGSANNVSLRWNETTDRWETTVNGNSYIELANQGLDTDDSPSFANVTLTANANILGNLAVTGTGTFSSLSTNNGVVFATNNGKLNTHGNLTWNGTTLGVNGNFSARYIDIVNGLNLNYATPNTIPYLNDTRYLVSTNNLTFNGSNLTLTGNQTVNGIFTVNNAAFIHNSNSYTQIASGTTGERPLSASAGMIRYNSSLSTFEGYAASAWGSLGGVKSIDGFTYIIPETSPGASNGELEFYAENSAGTATIKIGGWNYQRFIDQTGTVVGSNTTQNVFNSTATTVNAFGAATVLSLGSNTGTSNVNNNLYVAGNLTAAGTVYVSTSGIRFPTDAFGGSGDTATITLTAASGEATRMTFTMTNDADDKFNFVAPSSTGLLMNGNTVWHAGNDGDGSGLDADTLDGQQGTYYASNSYVSSRIDNLIHPFLFTAGL